MAFVAIGAAVLEGLIIGGVIGGAAMVIGGTIVLICELYKQHIQSMQRIMDIKEKTVQELKNRNEKELHKAKEFREVFKLFQLEVEQARKIIEEAEYTNENGKKIKGYDALVASVGRTEANKMLHRYEEQKKILNDPEKFINYKFD